jgi:hypothetical protein
MSTNSTAADDRLAKLGIHLPDASTSFGAYVPALQTGNLLLLSGMLGTSGRTASYSNTDESRAAFGSPRWPAPQNLIQVL